MKEVIGVRFRKNGKVYYFDPRDNRIELGTKVIVETSKGIEFGWVVIPGKEVDESRIQGGLKPIQRLATPQDIERYENNIERGKKAFDICLKKIHERGLEMKLISAEYAFDNNKVTFYFTADGRVDFRELVKDLAYALHTRIELRQVGIRDETRILGGIGMCGRELCCHSYLADFVPVSIKMAKEQSLSLNPTKISGVCGRLMCCLKNEQETYEYLNSLLPNVGDRVRARDGVVGEVASVNVLRQRVKIYVTDEEGNKEMVEYRVEELSGGHRGRRFDSDDEEFDPALEALEAPDISEDGEEMPGEGGMGSESGRHGSGRASGGHFQSGNKGDRNRGDRNFGGRRDHQKDGSRDNAKDSFRENSRENSRDNSRENGKDFSGKNRKKGGDGAWNKDGNVQGGMHGPAKRNKAGGAPGSGAGEAKGEGKGGRGDGNRRGGENRGDGQKKPKQQPKGGHPEGEAGRENQNGPKNFHKRNRQNNRPRESRKSGGQE